MKCAYCGEERKGTKEHIISKSVLDLFPESYLTFDEKRKKSYPADPVINDVCKKCNSEKLSYIDYYAKEFINKYFVKNYAAMNFLTIDYDYTMLQKVFLKYIYNDLRSKKKDTSFIKKTDINFLLDENMKEPLEYFDIFGGLSINDTPAPDFMLPPFKIIFSDNPLFLLNPLVEKYDCFTGETILSDLEPKVFPEIKQSYLFRFNSGQFIIIYWENKDKHKIMENRKYILHNYPYSGLFLSNKAVITQCTSYLNYHYHSCNFIDTTWGLYTQHEMNSIHKMLDIKNGIFDIKEKANEEYKKELSETIKKYKRK